MAADDGLGSMDGIEGVNGFCRFDVNAGTVGADVCVDVCVQCSRSPILCKGFGFSAGIAEAVLQGLQLEPQKSVSEVGEKTSEVEGAARNRAPETSW